MAFSALSAIFLVTTFLLRKKLLTLGGIFGDWLDRRSSFVQVVGKVVWVVLCIEFVFTVFISVLGLIIPILVGEPKHGNDLGEAVGMYLVMVTVIPLASGGVTVIGLGYYFWILIIHEHVQAPGCIVGFLDLVAIVVWTAMCILVMAGISAMF